MTDPDNRRVLGLLDRELTPSSTAGKVALAPLALPVGLAAFAADLAIVHPACVVDDAWLDTVDLLWTSKEESAFRRALFVPLATLATPFVFTGDWLGRCLFRWPPHAEKSKP